MNAFTQAFEPLSSLGSYIGHIRIDLDYYNYGRSAYLNLVKVLKLLSNFKIRRVTVVNWYVTDQMFKMLVEFKDKNRYTLELEYLNWVFRKTDNAAKLEYWIDRYINLRFKDWKYTTESNDETSEKFSLQDFPNFGFADFMVDFINIWNLGKKINELLIENWFVIITHTLKSEVFEDIENYKEIEEYLKDWLEKKTSFNDFSKFKYNKTK